MESVVGQTTTIDGRHQRRPMRGTSSPTDDINEGRRLQRTTSPTDDINRRTSSKEAMVVAAVQMTATEQFGNYIGGKWVRHSGAGRASRCTIRPRAKLLRPYRFPDRVRCGTGGPSGRGGFRRMAGDAGPAPRRHSVPLQGAARRSTKKSWRPSSPPGTGKTLAEARAELERGIEVVEFARRALQHS